MQWALPEPFVIDIRVADEAIDAYQHVNNSEYLRWVEHVSWAHSDALGLTFERHCQLDRALVVHRHELDYLAPAFAGDALQLATWIVECDGRFSLTRRFQLIRSKDAKTLLYARTRFACVALSTGRARRLPDEYQRIYGRAVIVE